MKCVVRRWIKRNVWYAYTSLCFPAQYEIAIVEGGTTTLLKLGDLCASDEFKAGNALSALNDTQIGNITLRLSYAKK